MNLSQSSSKVGPQREWQSNTDPWSSEEPQWTLYKPFDNDLLEEAYQNNQKDSFQGRPQWEWQSNADPWSSEEPQWTSYKPFDNDLIEKAYQNNQQEVNIGDYFISIKDRVQKKKDDIFKQRKIRRTEVHLKISEEVKVNEKENSRKKRFFGAETPKTMNKAFGNLEYFIQFFRNRGSEIKMFADLFEEIESSQNLERLRSDILPVLIDSITRESIKTGEEGGRDEIIKLFQEADINFQKFYGNILQAYTIEGFLYRNLNQYLRNEEWFELDCLLPYAFCLCKAFLLPKLTYDGTNHQNQGSQEGENKKIVLYRGAALDEISLSLYDPQSISNFSWNAVTSTSVDKGIAECFLYNQNKKKIPVMFIIEVPISSSDSKSLHWIDMKPFSVMKGEDEIALGPGSTFQLKNFSRTDQRVEIQLSLITNVNALAHQGQIMPGAMHAEMSTDKISKMVCLEGNELREAIGLLKGNQLIQELEITLCKYDADMLSKLKETLSEMPNLTRLACYSLSSKDNSHLNIMLDALSDKRIQVLEISDQLLEDEHQMLRFAQGIKNMISLTTLDLNFSWCKYITDQRLNTLASQGIKYLTSLTTLNLSFQYCQKITAQGLNNLFSQGIKYLTSLTTLNLNFKGCSEISNQGLNYLSFGCLISLTTLNLNFANCFQITDQGLNYLSSQGNFFTSLTTLNLNFYACYKITDQGLDSLKSNVNNSKASFIFHHDEQSDPSAPSRQCRFKRIIKNESVKEIKHNLETTFENPADNITIDTMDKLRCHWSNVNEDDRLSLIKCLNGQSNFEEWIALVCRIKYLTSSTTLNLKFNSKKITDDGLNNLCSQLKYLTSLTTLNLNFSWCDELTDEGLDYLSSQGIKYLTSLITLNLNFTRCKKITDEGLQNFSRGIRYLTSLTTLNLNFDSCFKITGQGWNDLSSQGIKYLTSLTTLNLNFTSCREIRDQGLNNLCSQLKYLTSLTTLNLNFSCCNRITDEGLDYLTSQVIKHLTSLTTLDLSFDGPEITDQGLKNFSQGIKHLISLTTLNLKFRTCSYITDEGLNDLCSQGIKYLTSLTTLNLDFGSHQITDQGLNDICSQGIKCLGSLTTLNIDLTGCNTISDAGFRDFRRILKYFGYHESFDDSLL